MVPNLGCGGCDLVIYKLVGINTDLCIVSCLGGGVEEVETMIVFVVLAGTNLFALAAVSCVLSSRPL